MVILTTLWMSPVFGQVSPEEHTKHHPGQAQIEGKKSGGGMGDMMGGGGMMDSMMEKMGAPKPKDMYPRLMDLPELSKEERVAFEREAHQRMIHGTQLISEGLDELSTAATNENFDSMQSATSKLREGLSQFDSGLAARRAIAEGKAPRNVALKWFKREMNMLPPAAAESDWRLWGMTPFHTSVMSVLVLFAAAVIWMYFFKMQRATELIQRLAIEPRPNSAAAERAQLTAPVSPPSAVRTSPSSGKKQVAQLKVARVFDETADVKTFRLVNADGGPIPFTYLPGQFLTLTVRPDGNPVRRSYTIASSPTQRYYCEVTIKREDQGVVSPYLHDRMQAGEVVEALGPVGKFTFIGEEANSIVLIGGGVGITPLMSVVRYLTDITWEKDIFLLYACRTPDDFIFGEELRSLGRRHPNLHLTVAMSRSNVELPGVLKGRLTKELITEAVPNIAARRVHLCGSPTLMSAVREMLAELSVAPGQIKSESFGPAHKEKTVDSVTSVPAPIATTATVTFQQSGKSAPLPPERTILDVAEEQGVDIDWSCRTGTCGSCIIKLLSGEVTMECEDGLDSDDKSAGMILACQAKTAGDVTVEA